MAKPSITKRLTKGAALNYTELDNNFQNLADATLSIKAGTAGTTITADLNGTITLVAGTNITLTGNNTTKEITIDATGGSGSPAGSNTQLQFNNSGSFGASSNLTWNGTDLSATNIVVTNSSGDEGGEIRLAKPITNTSISTSVTFDVYQNKVRIFETGGSNRGGYFDISALSAGVGTNLASGGTPTNLAISTYNASYSSGLSVSLDNLIFGIVISGGVPSIYLKAVSTSTTVETTSLLYNPGSTCFISAPASGYSVTTGGNSIIGSLSNTTGCAMTFDLMDHGGHLYRAGAFKTQSPNCASIYLERII